MTDMEHWLNTAPVGARRRWNAMYDVVIEDGGDGMTLIGAVFVGPRPPQLPALCGGRCVLDTYHDELLSFFGALG